MGFELDERFLFPTADDASWVPEHVSEVLQTIAAAERDETERITKALADAWADVQRYVELLKKREERFAQLSATLSEDISKRVFWTPESLGRTFSLADPQFPGDATQEKSVDDIAAKFAPASQRVAPLRHCFAGIMSKRATVPKECTLLLNSISELQSRLAPIEQRINEHKSVNLPLHLPFQAVAKLIDRTLIPAKTGEALEEALTAGIVTAAKELRAQYLALINTRDPKEVYAVLEKEAHQRRLAHQQLLSTLDEAAAVEKNMTVAFEAAHAAATRACEESVSHVAQQAKSFTDASNAMLAELEQLERLSQERVDAQVKHKRQQLGELHHRMDRCRRHSESYFRQIRQLHKNVLQEQRILETSTQQSCCLLTDVARLEEAQRQFRMACHQRKEALSDAFKFCEFVNSVSGDVSREVDSALAACRQHESRVLAEERHRTQRIAQQPISNAREWYRCIGDLLGIRTHRLESIKQRMSGSWQLAFLLTQEEQAQTAAIDAFNNEVQLISREWVKLSNVLLQLEVYVPVLHQYDKDETVVRMRHHFLSLENIGKDRDMKDVTRALDMPTSVVTVLPPIPPPRKQNRESTKDPQTGVRRLPRPSSHRAATPPTGGSLLPQFEIGKESKGAPYSLTPR